ncbi:MAG: acyl carrier protein [Lachnospiraceae bacterium]|nr:acyl carrier protein [Lachnospiraceae bacterium]
MTRETVFKKIVAQYCNLEPWEIKDEMRFAEDLGFSSLDFMSFLGELEDTFDVELDEASVLKIFTIGEALELISRMEAA